MVWVGALGHSLSQLKHPCTFRSSSFHLLVKYFPCHFSPRILSSSCCLELCFRWFLMLGTSDPSSFRHLGFGWDNSSEIPISSAKVLASFINDWSPLSAALSSNALTKLMVGSLFWYSLIADLIFVCLYSVSTDRRPRPPWCLGR